MTASASLKSILAELESALLPYGFLPNENVYHRSIDDCYALLSPVVSSRRRQITFDLAIHPQKLESLFTLKPPDPYMLQPADCLLHTRVGYFLEDDMDVWFDIDAELSAKLPTICNVAVEELAATSEKVSDESALLTTCTPNLLRSQKTLKRDDGSPVDVPAIRDYFVGWFPELWQMAVYLCKLAAARGDANLASEYAKIAIDVDIDERYQDYLHSLIGQ